MSKTIFFTVILIGIFTACSESEAAEKEETAEVEVAEEIGQPEESAAPPVEIPFVEGYLEDWEGIKGSLLLQDADSVGLWGTMYGLNAEELVSLVADEKITEKLKNTTYEDLIPDPKGEKNYFRFEAENSEGKKLEMYIYASPYTLMIDYYIVYP